MEVFSIEWNAAKINISFASGFIARVKIDYVNYISDIVVAQFLEDDPVNRFAEMHEKFPHAIVHEGDTVTLKYDMSCFQPALIFTMKRETLSELEEMRIMYQRIRDENAAIRAELDRSRDTPFSVKCDCSCDEKIDDKTDVQEMKVQISDLFAQVRCLREETTLLKDSKPKGFVKILCNYNWDMVFETSSIEMKKYVLGKISPLYNMNIHCGSSIVCSWNEKFSSLKKLFNNAPQCYIYVDGCRRYDRLMTPLIKLFQENRIANMELYLSNSINWHGEKHPFNGMRDATIIGIIMVYESI